MYNEIGAPDTLLSHWVILTTAALFLFHGTAFNHYQDLNIILP